MAVNLPDGAIVSLATTYGAAKTVTGITNANPGVATTSVAHSMTNGDVGVFSSGWSNLNSRVVRITSASGSVFSTEGIDTSSTALYPAGTGSGTFTPISTWTQIAQIMGFVTNGGEQQFTTYSFMEQNFESKIQTVLSAMDLALEIADDATLAGYIALKAAAEARATRALKLYLPNGSTIYYNGVISFNETPKLNKGQIMTVSATFALQSRPVRYST